MELLLIIDLETKRVLNAEYSGAKQATHSGPKYATHFTLTAFKPLYNGIKMEFIGFD